NPAGQELPSPEEILHPRTRLRAVRQLQSMLILRSQVVPGRIRPGGRRSRSVVPQFRVPVRMPRGRPLDIAGRIFVRWLELAYMEATNHAPPLTYHSHARGPYACFVHRCFELVCAPTGNLTKLL